MDLIGSKWQKEGQRNVKKCQRASRGEQSPQERWRNRETLRKSSRKGPEEGRQERGREEGEESEKGREVATHKSPLPPPYLPLFLRSKPKRAKPDLAMLTRPNLANPNLAKPSLAKPVQFGMGQF